MADPVSRESALARCKESGRRAALWGSPSFVNPFSKVDGMEEERAAWAAGHLDGAIARRGGVANAQSR